MDDLVEWLRNGAANQGSFGHKEFTEAADRIEALEKEVHDWAAGAAAYALRYETLTRALRKIVASEDDPLDYEYVVGIARDALKALHPGNTPPRE